MLPYSSMGLVYVLYVCVIVSFVFPQSVPVSVEVIFKVCLALLYVFLICSEYVSFGSSVMPSIFGFFVVGKSVLFMRNVDV